MEKTGINLKDVKPLNYLDGMTKPMMILIGDKDEMIKMDEVKFMFERSPARVKRIRVIKGGHSSERGVDVISQLSKFCSMIFKLNSIDKDPNYNRFRQRLASTQSTLDSIVAEPSSAMVNKTPNLG